jgi:exonuclease III
MSTRRSFASRKVTTRTLIGTVFSLTVVALICTLLTFPHALAAPIVSDNFNDNSLDTAKWDTNLFSGFTNTSLPMAETSQRLEIGPLLQNTAGSNYRGIRTDSSYNFSGAYSYVELVQPAAANTAADAMFTIGNDVDNYYRLYVSAGNLIGLKKIAGTKTTLFSITYNSTDHRFLRIRNDSGSVTLDTAPGSSGTPGTWTQRYTETWNSTISTSSIIFELKGGTWQSEANAPGTVIFDNFHVVVPGSPTPTPTPTPTPGTVLTMVAANLQHGQSTDETFHYDLQANKITSTSDLVAAQEVSQGDIPNWDAAFENGGFHRVEFRLNPGQGDGNAIWARDSLTEIQTYEHDLANGSSNVGHDGSDIRRSVVAAKFSFNSQQFYVASVHLCPSACRNSSTGTFESVQRVAQIQDLLSWIDSTLTGGLPVFILGDLNLTLDTPKQPSGFQFDLFTEAGFSDMWQTGLSNSLAEADWGDRDGDSIPDMPLGLNTRTHDLRRIDYILYKPNNGSISLVKISVPDGRAQCPQALVTGGNFKSCPAVTQLWDVPEDQGVRLSDHNWIWIELDF